MDALFYFLVWAVLIFLMMRFGCGAHVMGHGHSGDKRAAADGSDRGLRWVPPETDKDPVCGKEVGTETAKSSVYEGVVFYFCSRECREIFEASPGLYTGDRAPENPKQMEQANV